MSISIIIRIVEGVLIHAISTKYERNLTISKEEVL